MTYRPHEKMAAVLLLTSGGGGTPSLIGASGELLVGVRRRA